MSPLQALPRELKLPLLVSTAVHGLALGLLPVQGLPPPASPPALTVRLEAPAVPDKAAPPTAKTAEQRPAVAAAAPRSSGSRVGPELAEPVPTLASPRVQDTVPSALGLQSATTSATAVAMTPRYEAGLAEAAGTPAAIADSGNVVPLPSGHAPRLATASSPLGLPGTAEGQTASASPDATAEAGLAQRAPPTDALRQATTRPAAAAAAAAVGPGAATGLPELAEGARHAQGQARDKTPWQAAQPTWAQGTALPAARAQPEVAADSSGGEPRPWLAEPTLAPRPLRVASAVALSLLEAEDAPSNAIAYARLRETSRACFAPPPVHWNAQGRVLLRIRVDAMGHPVEVALESGSGEPRLDRLALAQARDCARFEILDRHGRPRAAVVRLPVVYRFSD